MKRVEEPFRDLPKIMWIALIISSVIGQVCVPLPSNTACGSAFTGYPILRSVSEFTSTLNSGVIDTNSVANTLISSQVCIAPQIFSAVNTLRFQASIQCGMAVQQAILAGCVVPSNLYAAGPLLCPPQCQIAAYTLNAMASNRTACPGPKLINTLTLSNFCAYVNSNLASNGSKCYAASTDEANFAGFSTAAIASAQCMTLPNDSACMSFSASQTPTSNNSTIIISIVVGALAMIAILALAYYFYRKRKQTKMSFREDLESKQAPSQSLYPRQKSLERKAPKKPTSHLGQTSSTPPRADITFLSPKIMSFRASLVDAPKVQEIEEVTLHEGPVSIEDLPEGTVSVKVVHPYQANLEDELVLVPNSFIFMVRSYDDGW